MAVDDGRAGNTVAWQAPDEVVDSRVGESQGRRLSEVHGGSLGPSSWWGSWSSPCR